MSSKFLAFLTAAGLALASTTAQAQRSDQVVAAPRLVAQVSNPTDPAVEMTRDMSIRLKLNEAQYIKLLQVNKTRLTQVAQIERNFKGDPDARTTKLSELDAQYQQECSRILTPSQLSQLHDEQPAQPGATPTGTGNGLG